MQDILNINNQLEIQNKRLLDPINYQEACYRLVWETRYKQMNIPPERIICWLGSHVGNSFLREVNTLIRKYPYVDSCSFVYINGKLVNSRQLLLHYCWFVEQGTNEKFVGEFFAYKDLIGYLLNDGRIVNNEFDQTEYKNPELFEAFMKKVKDKYLKLLNITL